ncbi:uncharacterized protein LOC144450824 isoform X2 [Glandiceps talaboti]
MVGPVIVIQILALLDSSVFGLKCHHCVENVENNDGGCNNASLVECTEEQDKCLTLTTWPDDGPHEMTLAKSCTINTECRGSENTYTPTCYPTEEGWACVYCCPGDGCNQGGSGSLPRPPPIPPVPEPLVQRMTGDCGKNSEACATTVSWSDADNAVSINKFCSKPVKEDYADTGSSEHCENQFCVSCCISEMNTCYGNNVSSAPKQTLSILYPLLYTLVFLPIL